MTRKNLALALKAYEYIRLPFASDVMSRSGKTGHLYEFRAPEAATYATWLPALCEKFDWVYNEDPKDQLERAIRWMEAQFDATRVVKLKL